jgi:hypothetical protein
VTKRSRRALVLAASFALGLSAVGPAAHAGLLGGSDASVEGVGLPVGGDLLGSVLGNDGLVGSLLGGTGLLGSTGLLGGGGGLPLVRDVLGGEGGPLGIVEGVAGGVLAGDEGILAGEGLADTLEVLPLGIVPGGESILEILHEFSDSGSIVPGLQVLDDSGVLGILGSL